MGLMVRTNNEQGVSVAVAVGRRVLRTSERSARSLNRGASGFVRVKVNVCRLCHVYVRGSWGEEVLMHAQPCHLALDFNNEKRPGSKTVGAACTRVRSIMGEKPSSS